MFHGVSQDGPCPNPQQSQQSPKSSGSLGCAAQAVQALPAAGEAMYPLVSKGAGKFPINREVWQNHQQMLGFQLPRLIAGG